MYKGLHEATQSYMRLQKDYMRLHRTTWGYIGLHEATFGYMKLDMVWLHEKTLGYIRLHRVT